MVAGAPIRFMAASIEVTAELSEPPGGRLKEIVLATRRPWWFTASGVAPCVKRATADSGIMVSWVVATAEPVEATPLPVAPIELVARFLAACALAELAAVPVPATTVPATALVDCDPPTEAPDVLIHTSFSISGFCQYCGATSMIT